MNEEHEHDEKKQDATPPRRPRADIVSSWIEGQRGTEAMLNPPMLRALEPSWLKAWSGAAAMPEVRTLFSTRDFNFAAGVIVDLERTRRILGGFTPAIDAARQIRAVTGPGAFPAIREATLAHERIARLIEPLEVTSLTRDLSGVSDAVAAVASMIHPPAYEFGRELGAIASSALGSWRTYVDALPPALDVGNLFAAQAAARSILGVTATTAILLGDEEAVEVAEEWELAPAETRERMRAGLRLISPHLLVRLDGAWDAVTHAGPDAASQAANSAIELIDWTLRRACDTAGLEEWVAAQPKPSLYRDDHGRLTRQARIRYLLRASDFEGEFVDATARNLDALRGQLQKLKHTDGPQNADAVGRLLLSVEAVLFLIVE